MTPWSISARRSRATGLLNGQPTFAAQLLPWLPPAISPATTTPMHGQLELAAKSFA
jgi:hypothetical protein